MTCCASTGWQDTEAGRDHQNYMSKNAKPDLLNLILLAESVEGKGMIAYVAGRYSGDSLGSHWLRSKWARRGKQGVKVVTCVMDQVGKALSPSLLLAGVGRTE